MGDLLDGVSIVIVELFAMLVMWTFIVAALVTVAGLLCLALAAAIRFAIRELRAKGLRQAPIERMEEMPSGSVV